MTLWPPVFALVQAGVGSALYIGVVQPANDEESSFDPSDFAESVGQHPREQVIALQHFPPDAQALADFLETRTKSMRSVPR